jgi:hypothetical protein
MLRLCFSWRGRLDLQLERRLALNTAGRESRVGTYPEGATMSDSDQDRGAFVLGDDFSAGETSEGLGLGPLGSHYEELFAEVLEDGVITAEERAKLERAAENLGLDRERLLQLEQAMVAAYEAHHQVRIVEQYEQPAASLAPLVTGGETEADRQLLVERIEQLEARVHELEDELRRAQAQINVEVDLSDLELAAGEAAEDPQECWRRVRRDPTQAAAMRELYQAYAARSETDKQWCVAQALVLLQSAGPEERALFEKYHSLQLITPGRGVSNEAWHGLLLHPEQEALTGQIFAVIAPAVLLGRVTALRRDGKLQQPDPEARQDLGQATVTAVRALAWGASIMGLSPPPVYIDKSRAVGFQHVPAVPPVTVVGKAVLSGRSQLEQAFLAGRHLAWYRPEHYIKTLFNGVPDLEDLFLAALMIGSPGLPISSDMKQRVTPIAQAIEPVLQSQQVDALRGYFLRFVEEGGRTNLQRWSAAVEKTACRAGLLLCNDIATAVELLQQEEGELGELARDLLAFLVSERYFDLRRQLGIAVDQH